MCRELEIGAKNLLDLLHPSCSYLTFISFVSSAAVLSTFQFLWPLSLPISLAFFHWVTKWWWNTQTKDSHLPFVSSLAGALMAGIVLGKDTDSCVRMGLLAARTSLASPHPIAPMLTLDAVNPNKVHTQTWPKPSLVWID